MNIAAPLGAAAARSAMRRKARTASLATARTRAGQRGVVLFTALILLVILTLVGVMLTRMQTVEEQISENDQDHQLAIQAAEAALRFAEVGLFNGTYTAFAGNNGGMYTWESGLPDAYTQYVLGTSPASMVLSYGGPALPVASTPVFLIENMPAAAIQGSSLAMQQYGAPTPPVSIFRITAYSYGGDQSSTAELQEIDWQQ
ncbi:MAG TPA: PilX N-terminal domain-containing pilus assembly protein [Steroidobacteraceae bacterium]|nr:PilX N-terminal domain-containing pilus assembly protein [Steroidobacteraceae bacterium]